MFKLIILIEPEIDQETFFEGWPQFMEHAESMPGLVRAVTAPVHQHLFGRYEPLMLHELIFETEEALFQALAAPEGVSAGEILQSITGGAVTLLVSAHLEEDGDKLRSFQQNKPKKED